MAASTKMTQAQIVADLAAKCELNKRAAKDFLDHLAALAVKEVKKNGVFIVPGVGRLVKTRTKARKGRNPATGAEIRIPAKTAVKFRIAKACKDAIVPPKKPRS